MKTMFETLIDDTLDDDVTYQLMNHAKDEVELEREWEILKKLDSSQSANSSAKTLPTDFLSPIRLYVNTQPYFQIPFEQKPLFANSGLRWYLDLVNSVYYLLGQNISGTINLYYIYKTDDIAAGTSPVWPSKFHKRIPFKMAELFFAADQSDRGNSWDDKWKVEATVLKNLMIDWDEAIKIRANENALAFDEYLVEDIGSY